MKIVKTATMYILDGVNEGDCFRCMHGLHTDLTFMRMWTPPEQYNRDYIRAVDIENGQTYSFTRKMEIERVNAEVTIS